MTFWNILYLIGIMVACVGVMQLLPLGLSVFFSRFAAVSLVLLLVTVTAQFIGLAIGYRLGEMLGSTALGFAITGSFFLLLAIIVYLLRKRLFVNSFVMFFVKLFFEEK